MAVNLSPYGGVGAQFLDNSGNVLTGGKIFTYAAGTTTNQATYTSAAGATPHSNPIILDASGRVPSGEIWLTDGLSYKFVLTDSNDVLIATYDNVIGINSNFVNYSVQEEIQTATAGQTIFTLTTINYTPGTNSLSVFVDGVNQYDGISYAYVETNSTTVTFTAGLHVGALVKFTTATTLSSGVTTAALTTFTGFNGQSGVVQDLADDDGSDWIGFDQAGTGAVARSAQEKMRDVVSVKDFGAVGDGTADDTAAIQLALNSNATVYFPDGTYKITDTLTVNSATRRIYGNGNKTVIAPYLTAGQTCFELTVQAVRFEMDGFYFNLPAGEQSDVLAIEFSSVTPANRGNTISNIWIQGLQKGFTAGDTFARITIQNWNHLFLEANTVGAISINLPNQSNTTFMKDVDIIGGFEYGVYHAGRVFSIRDFNIAGTGTYLMTTAIYLNGSAVGQIETGWIEKLINPGDPGDQPAIYLDTAQAVSINNVNVANGSIYIEDGIGNTINTCQFGNNTGGIRTVGFPDYSINASNQLQIGGDAIAFYREPATGRVTVTGYNNEKPKRGYLAQANSLMTNAPTRTNAGLVTLTADTADFLTGTQSQLVTTAGVFQGVQFAFASLIVGQVYTFTCFTKSTSANDVVALTTSVGSRNNSYPQVTAGNQTDWQMLSIPVVPDSSGNLTVRVRNNIVGSFKIDCAQLWLGYRLDQPEQTLP